MVDAQHFVNCRSVVQIGVQGDSFGFVERLFSVHRQRIAPLDFRRLVVTRVKGCSGRRDQAV